MTEAVGNVVIEPLTRDRAAELAEPLLAMSADSTWDDWDRSNLLSERPGKWDLSLLATIAGRPVGWAIASRTGGGGLHLHHIVVDPAHRSEDIGSRLVSALASSAAPGRMTLKVHPDNSAAARFYKRLGFVEEGMSSSGYRRFARDYAHRPKRVAVHQPNYAPWCGYFAKLFSSESFIFFDDVQLPQGRSYVSRAKIAKGPDGDQWLTVPISKSGNPTIDEVRIADGAWAAKHVLTLRHVYARSAHAEEVLELIDPVYEQAGDRLAQFNMALVERVSRYLGWTGTFHRSSEHPADLKADQRIADLVNAVGGDVYVSGAGGENYQTASAYAERGVELEVRTYQPREYARSSWPFVPGLSVLDALFHQGRNSRAVMTYPDA